MKGTHNCNIQHPINCVLCLLSREETYCHHHNTKHHVEQINKVKFSKSNPDTTNMVVTMRITAGIRNFIRGGAESFTSAKSAKAWSLFELFLIKVGSASSRSTSPACSLIFPGSHEYDDLYNEQKSLRHHIWCGNPIKLLIRQEEFIVKRYGKVTPYYSARTESA